MMQWLAQDGVNELHIEAGYKLNGSLLREQCVDELLIYLAPRLLGPGMEMFDLPALERIPDQSAWEFLEAERLGPDLRLRMRKSASLQMISQLSECSNKG